MSSDPKPPRPFKVWSCDRQIKKAVVVASFEELKEKGKLKLSYECFSELVVVLENDGTEVEDDVYFNTLDKDTVFLLLRSGEKWYPPGKDSYSSDSYGIQICEVISAAPQSRPGPKGNAAVKQPAPIETPTPSATLQQLVRPTSSEEDSSSSSEDSEIEYFTVPHKDGVRSSAKSINYFRDLARARKRHANANSSPAKSRWKPARRIRPGAANEDAIACSNISFELPKRVEKAARAVDQFDERAFWSHAATEQLIRTYQYYRPHFIQPRGQLKVVWKLVANRMYSHGFEVSAKACDKKWRNLKMTYKTITRKMSLGWIKTKKIWQYYGLMREALTRHVRPLNEVEYCREDSMDYDWLAEFFRQKKEQEVQELEEIRRVSHHSIEQLRKENESLQLLNEYLASYVTK